MSNKLSQQAGTIWKYTKFIFKNIKAFRASRQLYDVRKNLSLANIDIGKMIYHDPIYAQRVKEFNRVMLELVQGKWLAACAMEAKDSQETKRLWEQAFAKIRKSKEYSQRLMDLLYSKSEELLNLPGMELCSNGTEILFAEGARSCPRSIPLSYCRAPILIWVTNMPSSWYKSTENGSWSVSQVGNFHRMN